MEAKVLDVFIGNAADIDPEVREHLGESKDDPALIEKIDFIKKHYAHVFFEVEESNDPSDGSFYWQLIGFFVNGNEVKYVSNWLPNGTKNRKAIYVVEVPTKYLKLNKVISIQVKTAPSKVYWRKDVPREYTEKSEMYYLKLTDYQGAYN